MPDAADIGTDAGDHTLIEIFDDHAVETIPDHTLLVILILGRQLLGCRTHWSGPQPRAEVERRMVRLQAEYDRRFIPHVQS